MELLKDMVIVGLFIMLVGMAALQAARIVKFIKYQKLRKLHREKMARIRERNRIRGFIASMQEAHKDIDRLFYEKEIIARAEQRNELPGSFYEGMVG